jgi:hypothetical protein
MPTSSAAGPHRSHDSPRWPVPRAPGNREAISCLCRRHNIASNTTGSPVSWSANSPQIRRNWGLTRQAALATTRSWSAATASGCLLATCLTTLASTATTGLPGLLVVLYAQTELVRQPVEQHGVGSQRVTRLLGCSSQTACRSILLMGRIAPWDVSLDSPPHVQRSQRRTTSGGLDRNDRYKSPGPGGLVRA